MSPRKAASSSRPPSPLTFADFMLSALYDEERGYYMTSARQFGSAGDFYTAGQVHELFGALLAEECVETDRALGSPPLFTLIELGPGRGEVARDLLAALEADHPELFERLRYICCEISPALTRAQRETLARFSDRAAWIRDLDELAEPIEGLFLANEFFDALPVHVIRWRAGRLSELYVAANDRGEYHWVEGELSRPEMADYWRRAGAPLVEGQRAEIGLAAVEWIRRIAGKLARGRLLAIDYGDLAPRLYTPDRFDGTLRGYCRHQLCDDPLLRPGEQDLTASVNFSALIEYGRDAGLETITIARLTSYLIDRGLLERAAGLAATAASESPRELQHRLALKHLFLPQGLAGSFKALVMKKGR